MTEENNTPLSDRARLWAKRSAVHYLGTYASSVENLRVTMLKRAKRKFPDLSPSDHEELASTAVDFCSENGFVNDASYMETKVAAGIRKGHSRRKIAMSLEHKGIDSEAAREAVREIDDLEPALVFARKKRIGPWRKTEIDQKTRQKEAAAFARNGFSGDVTFKIIAMSTEEAEEAVYGTIEYRTGA